MFSSTTTKQQTCHLKNQSKLLSWINSGNLKTCFHTPPETTKHPKQLTNLNKLKHQRQLTNFFQLKQLLVWKHVFTCHLKKLGNLLNWINSSNLKTCFHTPPETMKHPKQLTNLKKLKHLRKLINLFQLKQFANWNKLVCCLRCLSLFKLIKCFGCFVLSGGVLNYVLKLPVYENMYENMFSPVTWKIKAPKEFYKIESTQATWKYVSHLKQQSTQRNLLTWINTGKLKTCFHPPEQSNKPVTWENKAPKEIY